MSVLTVLTLLVTYVGLQASNAPITAGAGGRPSPFCWQR